MIEELKHLIHLIPHDKDSLEYIVNTYHNLAYVILALIIFCETGLVVTPFLPGDSLLFAAGVVSTDPNTNFNVSVLAMLLFAAAVLGDNSNYAIGRFLGKKILGMKKPIVRQDYLDKTHKFYEKHGGKALIIARFAPIIRTFAPFVAGLGTMAYNRFLLFCILGNLLWINSFLWVGYLLGNNEFVKNHFTQVITGIIIVSLIPPIYAGLRNLFNHKSSS